MKKLLAMLLALAIALPCICASECRKAGKNVE